MLRKCHYELAAVLHEGPLLQTLHVVLEVLLAEEGECLWKTVQGLSFSVQAVSLIIPHDEKILKNLTS